MTSAAGLRVRRIRVILGVLILIFSIALLVWGFRSTRYEVRTQPISPTELQLPTPASFLTEPELPC